MWTSATKIDALSKFRGHSPIKLVHEGFVCGQDLRQVPSISTPTKSKALGCHASKEYNSSNVDKFITFMQQAKSWKHQLRGRTRWLYQKTSDDIDKASSLEPCSLHRTQEEEFIYCTNTTRGENLLSCSSLCAPIPKTWGL